MTQQDPSAAEVNSTKSRTPEQRDKWNAYMRAYRKNRRIREKLAAGETIAIGNSEVATEDQSSNSGLPDAA